MRVGVHAVCAKRFPHPLSPSFSYPLTRSLLLPSLLRLRSLFPSFADLPPPAFLLHRYSEKIDVYSYGVFLWEVVAQRLPQPPRVPNRHALFTAATEGALRPTPPDYCPNRLAAVITSSLRWIPSARPTFRSITRRLAQLRQEIECVEPAVVARNTWAPVAPLISERGHLIGKRRKAKSSWGGWVRGGGSQANSFGSFGSLI